MLTCVTLESLPNELKELRLFPFRVRRNKETPSFSNLPATISLDMSTERGTQVFSVESRDGDEVAPFNELTFSITGDDNAPAFFAIDDEGKITVRADLTTAPRIRSPVQGNGCECGI